MIVGVALVPHPPIILEEIGRGEERKAKETLRGMEAVKKKIRGIEPDLIICISPHGAFFSDGFCFLDERWVHGDFGSFGMPELSMKKEVAQELNRELEEVLAREGIPALFLTGETAKEYGIKAELDHGCMVPLKMIDEGYESYRILHITVSGLSRMAHYRLGMVLAKVLERSNLNAVVVASGDLSHALKEKGPYSYHPSGSVFDHEIREAIRKGDVFSLVTIDEGLATEAAQCGLPSFLVGLGVLDGKHIHTELFSYEGPFGVGYLTAFLEPGNPMDSWVETLDAHFLQQMEEQKKEEDPVLRLARRAIEEKVRHRHRLLWRTVREEEESIHDLEEKRFGAFVSIFESGQLRGCIGTTEPSYEHLGEEIIANAIAAAMHDSRFLPIEPKELPFLSVKVDVVQPPEAIKYLADLNPQRYGVVVEWEGRRGVLLPRLKGVDTATEQVRIAKHKAGIPYEEKVKMYRFEVIRYENK
jgi:AmmeMemoRadiSam system protein A